MDDWTPHPTFAPRFWVGCAVMLLSVSFLVTCLISFLRMPDPDQTYPWQQTIFAILMLVVGARLALSRGNLTALKARFS